jgi:hypothetical protein
MLGARTDARHSCSPSSRLSSGAGYAPLPAALELWKTLYSPKRLIGVSSSESGLDFFAGGPE